MGGRYVDVYLPEKRTRFVNVLCFDGCLEWDHAVVVFMGIPFPNPTPFPLFGDDLEVESWGCHSGYSLELIPIE